jgi:hypothetical protein
MLAAGILVAKSYVYRSQVYLLTQAEITVDPPLSGLYHSHQMLSFLLDQLSQSEDSRTPTNPAQWAIRVLVDPLSDVQMKAVKDLCLLESFLYWNQEILETVLSFPLPVVVQVSGYF